MAQQFSKVLAANRGEIAIRIFRACHDLGLHTVAMYSNEDTFALFRTKADEAYLIGENKSPLGAYLDIPSIIDLAKRRNVDAIHPGYGFLSENADFAKACEDAGITFIGPSSKILAQMGDKLTAKAIAKACNVPTIPGSTEPLKDADEALEKAISYGFPIILKAAAGGGGRGMRRVFDPDALVSAFEEARAEAVACFGDGEMYLEKLILNPRHIEFQIMADKYGNVVHLGERDCSIQRRNQKLMEESPSRALSDDLRERMGRDAVQAARACGYEGAGTVEFVLDGVGNYYFIEMNTRIQVEHPITEMVTGLDLVREQLRIAAGLELPVRQEQVCLSGHAIEVRVNAEDPAHDFRPAPGVTRFLHLPGGCGVRVDTALYNGCELSPWYDSLAAKVIVHAPTRLQAIRRMRRALEELVVEGYPTGADLAHMILYHPDYLKGEYDTGFLEQNLESLLRLSRVEDESE